MIDGCTNPQCAHGDDAGRLDWLEAFVNREGGIVLHTGVERGWNKVSASGFAGLGLRPGSLVRTLREAIDSAMRIQAERPLPTDSVNNG